MSEVFYSLKPRAGLHTDRCFLSTTSNGDKCDLWNALGPRQKWKFAQVEGCYGMYNIILQENISNGRRMLSCRSDGFVDLYDHDDGSGRQRWKVVPQANGSILMQIAGGTNSGETYLSCTADGRKVDLYNKNDNSGRQEWIMEAVDYAQNNSAFYSLMPRDGLSTDRRYLSTTADGGKCDLWSGLGPRQKWRFEEVAGCYNTYNIILQENISNGRRMLSCRSDGYVDLYDRDDGSGRQRWNVVPQANGSILIQVAGGTNSGETYLSCTANGGKVDLYDKNDHSGRQEWIMEATDCYANHAVYYSLVPRDGLSSDRRYLSTTSNGDKCDLWSGLGPRQKWRFIPIEGCYGQYNIELEENISNGRRLLSCRSDGFVDLYDHDDGSGRQRWNVYAQANGSVLISVADGTNSGETYLSCTADGRKVDLYDKNDNSGRQEWVMEVCN